MSTAVEYAVISFIYGAVFMRPKLHLLMWVHPGVHGAGHQPSTQLFQDGIDVLYIPVEEPWQGIERGNRAVGLDLYHVQRQFIRPFGLAHFHIVYILFGYLVDDFI